LPLKDLFVKNSTSTFLTYEGRRASSDISGSVPELDLQRGHQSLYGRVDYNLNAVYPSEGFLREIEDGIFVLNFVADAYNDLKSHYQKLINLKRVVNKGKLKQIKAKKGWRSLNDAHHNYVSSIFQLFFKTYASAELNTPEKFIKRFLEFLRDGKNNVFVTRTAFVESTLYNPLMSGLFIELSDESKGDDVIRRKYYEDDNFVIFQNSLKLFGFKSDKNHPWRIIADIESQPMREYLQNYGLNTRTLFDKYFYKAYELDIDVMKQYFLEYYNVYDLKISKVTQKEEYVRKTDSFNPIENTNDSQEAYNSLQKYYDELSKENPTIQTKEIKFVELNKTTEQVLYPTSVVSATVAGDGEPEPEPEPEELYGETIEDIPLLLTAISEEPEEYPDGEPVYVNDIDGEGTSGWVVIYNDIPVPVTQPDIPSVQTWITTYNIPDGIPIYVEDDGSGSGGIIIVHDGYPVPAGQIGRTYPCYPSFNLNGTDPKRPAPREEGSGIDVDFDASDLPDIASVGDPP
jgi:hypothetical protein